MACRADSRATITHSSHRGGPCERIFREIAFVIGSEIKELLVYGFSHCHYGFISLCLTKTRLSVYKYDTYYPSNPHVKALPSSSCTFTDLGRLYKDVLVSAVLENCRRVREGKGIIPLLFCADIEGNPYPLSSVRSSDDYITVSEMKRIYKMTKDPSLPEEFRKVAMATCFFVKVIRLAGLNYTFERIAPPWELYPHRWTCKVSKIDSTTAVSSSVLGAAGRRLIGGSLPVHYPKKPSWREWVKKSMLDFPKAAPSF